MNGREEALRNQVVALTMDCHYLISLLNSNDEIDWENWPEGKKIKDDVERSQELLERLKDLETNPAQRKRKSVVRPIHRQMPLSGPLDDPFFTSFFGNF